jgi:hypothetical protein
MPYIEGRVVHDADSYIFEPPGTVERFASRLVFTSAERHAFSCDNFVDFMGRCLAPAPRR